MKERLLTLLGFVVIVGLVAMFSVSMSKEISMENQRDSF